MKLLKNGANLIKNNLPKLKMRLEALAKQEVLVGIPAETATVRSDETTPINNATIGYIMEHGAPESNIEARPFLMPGVEAVKSNIVDQFRRIAKVQMKGDKEAAERGFNRAGLIAQNSVRRMINSGIPPALAPSTLAARRRRGRTGTKPLIDTGQLRNSITYVIRSK
jgi:phage gpG-like protein